MNLTAHRIVFLFILVVVLGSCSKPNLEEESKNIKRDFETYLPEVSLMLLEKDTFFTEVVSNGLLNAANKVAIKPQTAGSLNPFSLSNGTFVSAGQLLFTLTNPDLEQALTEAQLALQQANYEFLDRLASYANFSLADTSKLDSKILRSLKIQSGLTLAELRLKKAKEDLRKLSVRSPIHGRIANLDQKPYNYVSASDEICLVLDDRSFEVVFSVLETELSQLSLKQQVTVSPYAFQGSYKGVIKEINPLVENGMVTIKARVNNQDGRLVDGLNVQVTIQNSQLDQLVVPKEAVVPRDGRRVVFTLEPDSTVYWNYVEVGQENVNEYAIVDGLEAGDQVVITGNINLAHQSKVKVSGE